MRLSISYSLLCLWGIGMTNYVYAFQQMPRNQNQIFRTVKRPLFSQPLKRRRKFFWSSRQNNNNVRPIQVASDIDISDLSPMSVEHVNITNNTHGTQNDISQTKYSGGNTESDNNTDDVPSVQRILRFAIPTIGVWLCSPLLSLIDTSAVGILSGTVQQAALAPAVSITDYGALLMAFLYTGTTNLVAAAQEKDGNDENHEKTQTTLVGALQLASYVGVGFAVLFGLSAKLLIQTIISNDAVDPVVFRTAVRYCRIRSLGLPAAAVIGSAQAACLGMQDMKSPLYVLLAAAVVNFFGDMILVRNPNMWIGGAAGAAWATVLSQYTALAMFMAWLKFKPRQRPTKNDKDNVNINMHQDESKIMEAKPGKRAKEPMSRGILAGKFRFRDLLKGPSKSIAKQFSPYFVPVTAICFGRISAFIAMSHVASSSLGTLEMAAQQILFSFSCCFLPIADSLSSTAQSFVPRIFERKPSPARTDSLKRTTINFIKAGGIFGFILAAVMAFIPLVSPFFSLDPAVIAKVNSPALVFALIFFLYGIICPIEGTMLGQKDLGFLAKSYAVFFITVPAFLLRLKKVAASGIAVGVKDLWSIIAAYQVVRTVTWTLRARYLHRKRKKEDQEHSMFITSTPSSPSQLVPSLEIVAPNHDIIGPSTELVDELDDGSETWLENISEMVDTDKTIDLP